MMEGLNSEIVFITAVQMVVILVTIVVELVCLRGFLKRSNII